ncbi:hypothetical protein BJV74DRAFT_858039 [Russula compacta]|nr:hypothetical protein BJV74DRAFT_858039 [Russula compacta]
MGTTLLRISPIMIHFASSWGFFFASGKKMFFSGVFVVVDCTCCCFLCTIRTKVNACDVP